MFVIFKDFEFDLVFMSLFVFICIDVNSFEDKVLHLMF